ncbi:MAG: hypothetical protein FWF79_09805, partial [Defluviitaleaceae bacterium]|nr:hypothetical protein [Defluviitaleaceae bacterium]
LQMAYGVPPNVFWGVYHLLAYIDMLFWNRYTSSENPYHDTAKSAKKMVDVAHSLGLASFMYFSGRRGVHVDIFFDEAISINKLNALNNILLRKHYDLGGRHYDCSYPSGLAYRIFGCSHYKTGEFTFAYKPEYDGNKILRMHPATPAESWELFSRIPFNDFGLVDRIIADHPDISKFTKDKKVRVKAPDGDYAPSAHCWDSDVLKQLHESGLFPPYTRYNTSYHLGRYFKYGLQLNADEAQKEIKSWLKRHFKEQCTDYNQLTPFEGADRIVKTPYAMCEVETLKNCLLGFKSGKPFRRELVRISYDNAHTYIRSLKYSHKKERALLTLLDKAVGFGSLTIGVGYVELMEWFRVRSRTTISRWLKEFQSDSIFICVKRGSFDTKRGTGKTSKYYLQLPQDCYIVIE